MCKRNKVNKCDAVTFLVYKTKWGGRVHTWAVQSDPSTVTAPATVWLIAVQAGNMVTSCPEEYLLLTLARTKKSVDWVTEKHEVAGGISSSEKWEMSLNSNTSTANRYTGLYELVMGAVTIHTCSLYRELYMTDDNAPFIFLRCNVQF